MLTFLSNGCTISEKDFSEDFNEVSLYVDFKISPKKVRWKLMTLPADANVRTSIPGPIFYESMIIVFDVSKEDAKKINGTSTKITASSSIPVPSEFIKQWIPSESAKKLSSKNVDQSFFSTADIITAKTKTIDSFAILDDTTVTVYINYRNS
jgi:hypothetical protein